MKYMDMNEIYRKETSPIRDRIDRVKVAVNYATDAAYKELLKRGINPEVKDVVNQQKDIDNNFSEPIKTEPIKTESALDGLTKDNIDEIRNYIAGIHDDEQAA